MSPLRWDVLLPRVRAGSSVLAMGLRGDLTTEEVALRLPWCLAAAWGTVALLRLAGTPSASGGPADTKANRPAELADTPAPEGERSPRRLTEVASTGFAPIHRSTSR